FLISFKMPGLAGSCFSFFSNFSFSLCDYKHRIFERLSSFFKTLTLCRCQHLFFVLKFSGSLHDMVCRHCDFYVIISKLLRKFATSPELHVLPTFYIIIHAQSWKKLRNDKALVAIWERFVS